MDEGRSGIELDQLFSRLNRTSAVPEVVDEMPKGQHHNTLAKGAERLQGT